MKDEQVKAINTLCYEAHQASVMQGFYDVEPTVENRLLLTITELCESFEGMRKNKTHDEHCPEFTNEEIETADAVIRLFDYSEWRKLRLGAAIQAKMEYNKTRPYLHGKRF